MENLDYGGGTNTGACGRKYGWVHRLGVFESEGAVRGTGKACACVEGVPEGTDPDYLRWGGSERGPDLVVRKASEGIGTSTDVSGGR